MAPFIVPTVAFIIGADTGVGFQLARTLARDFSYHVFIGSPSYEEARTTASKLQPHSLFPVSAINIDLERDESITEAVDHFKSRRIKIDVLVINTGGDLFFAPDASLAARRLAFQNSFNTHTISAALLIDTCAPLLNRGDTPRVVLFSSIFGSITTRRDLWTPWPVDTSGVLPECASYAALNMVAAAYASKYRNWRINAVCPGYGEQPPILVVYDGILGVMTKKEATYEVITQLVKMCTLGPDGETGTFTNKDGVLPW